MRNIGYRRIGRSLLLWIVPLVALSMGGCPPVVPPGGGNTPTVAVTVLPSAANGTVEQTANGNNVTLTPMPATGWLFDSWSGATVPDPHANPLVVDATQITSITATFVADNSTGSPRISVTILPSAASGSVPQSASGNNVTLTPTPAAGWLFDSWSGATVSDPHANPLVVDATQIRSITANFVQHNSGSPTVNVTILPSSASGSVSQSASGNNVTLTPVPASGWLFDSWSGATLPNPHANPLVVDATQITAITATFVTDNSTGSRKIRVTILPSAASGSVNQSASRNNVTLTPVPASGWLFDSWSGATLPNPHANPLVVDATQITSITATFVQQNSGSPTVHITILPSAASGSVSQSASGNNVTLTPVPAAGWQFDSWSGATLPNPHANPLVVDGTQITSITATFVTSGGGGTTPVCGNGKVENGEQCDTGGESATCNSNCTTARCGDAIVNASAGEQCDDGNTTSGDGCSATCQTEPGSGLANDLCANPKTVGDGTTTFASVGATTDGPADCTFFGNSDIASDVWFCYTATCTGTAAVGLCGSGYDTKMAVYSGCACPSSGPLTCSDDDCGSGVENTQSRVTLSVTAGQSYMVRVGGYAGAQGDGQLTISCGQPDICTTATGDCMIAHGDSQPGCATATCCNAVCAVDRFCCDVTWDSFCASEASGYCTTGFPTCSTRASVCTSAQTSPGCNNVECCNAVCLVDPFCCITAWDQSCADRSNLICTACGGRAGDCFTAHAGPGCSSVSCCAKVCASDSFCCDTEWDASCAPKAATMCR